MMNIFQNRLGVVVCFVFSLMICGVVGCYKSSPSMDELVAKNGALRAESIRPWREIQVDGILAFDYLLQRTALVWNNSVELGAVDIPRSSNDEPKKQALVGVSADGESTRKVGSAIPIHPDGYFLTAAHCVLDRDALLLYENGLSPALELRGEVIWNGLNECSSVIESSIGGCDLAIVYVQLPDDLKLNCMRWSENQQVVAGAKVLIGGAGATSIRLVGGVIEEEGSQLVELTSNPTDNDTAGLSKMWGVPVRAPLIPGDSGGPAMLEDGRLVGVSVAIKFGEDAQSAQILRPDQEWLNTFLNNHIEKNADSDSPATPRTKLSMLGWTRINQQREAIEKAMEQ